LVKDVSLGTAGFVASYSDVGLHVSLVSNEAVSPHLTPRIAELKTSVILISDCAYIRLSPARPFALFQDPICLPSAFLSALSKLDRPTPMGSVAKVSKLYYNIL
jgi:hypothetical protein